MSTKEQNESRQLVAMEEFGIEKNRDLTVVFIADLVMEILCYVLSQREKTSVNDRLRA